MTHFVIKIYGWLLGLYPAAYKKEFREQMLMDFADMVTAAEEKGKPSILLLCVREMFDFPFNLLLSHWQTGAIFQVFRFQPVNSGLRTALGFGIGFAAAALVIWNVSAWLLTALDYQISYISVWIYDTFRNENGTALLWNMIILIATALESISFGLVFALGIGRGRSFARYMVVGSVGWFIPFAFSFVLFESFGWPFFLSTLQITILGYSIKVLVGVCLGAIFYLAESGTPKSLRLFAVCGIAYPLVAFLYIKFIFFLWLEISPWFFVAMMVLMIVAIGSIFTLVWKVTQKMPWTILVGAIAYPLLSRGAYHLVQVVFRLPLVVPGEVVIPESLVMFQLNGVLVQAVLGLFLGLLLGAVIGLQNLRTLRQINVNRQI